jgi:Cu(I)/Ag(I) efflux system membrane fusion protein
MSERNVFLTPGPSENGPPRADEGGLHAPPGLSPLGKFWWWFHFAVLVKLARLRFIAVLVAIGLVIARWDWLSAHYDKWTRPLFGQEAAVSADTEYWCPMHPTVVRDHPDKCPICAMPLSKRKKGDKADDEALPPGVVGRIQLSPYKVAVAGVETAEVGYRPLTREITTVGFVEFDERKLARISARATGKSRIDKLYVNVTGQTVGQGEPLAELYSPSLVVTVQNLLDARQAANRDLERMARERLQLWGIDDGQIDMVLRTGKPITHVTIRAPIHGHVIKKYQVKGEYVEEGTRLYDVADLSTVWIEAQVYEDDLAFLQQGMTVRATTRAFPNRTFRGKLDFIHPHLDASTRTLRVRYTIENRRHDLRPGMYATVRLETPTPQLTLFTNHRRREWAARAAADLAAHALLAPGLPGPGGWRALAYEATERAAAAQGLVLAVPERAVIDTGSRKVVYREAEPDTYEGVLVRLGPRSGDFYPVLSGLRPGDRVVTTGSFLIDAETRLGAGAASTYFGASGGPQGSDNRPATAARPSMTRDETDKARAVLAKFLPDERRRAEEQGYCPVLGTRLGAMGVPVKVTLDGRPVYLCCSVCLKKARGNAEATLRKVEELKARVKRGSPPLAPLRPAAPPAAGSMDAKIRANLAKLSPQDRRLAEEQGYCPIQEKRLGGAMGVPVKVEIKGRPVFLCCEACKDEALEAPDETLAQVEKMKARTKTEAGRR